MRGLIVFGFLISTIIVCVLSENDQPSGGAATGDNGEVAVRADQLVHSRSKRSPYDPIVPGILLGKSFLLGALAGKVLGAKKGWGWRRPRIHRGWGGWSSGWSSPVVHHHHSHGGWGGWQSAPVVVESSGWGWAR